MKFSPIQSCRNGVRCCCFLRTLLVNTKKDRIRQLRRRSGWGTSWGRLSSTLTIADKITKGRIVRTFSEGRSAYRKLARRTLTARVMVTVVHPGEPLASNSSTKMRSISDDDRARDIFWVWGECWRRKRWAPLFAFILFWYEIASTPQKEYRNTRPWFRKAERWEYFPSVM